MLVPSCPAPGGMVGPYSLCTTACTAQCWERGSRELSVTVHVSLLALKARWLVEQKLSKKEMLVPAAVHSTCSDSKGSAASPPPRGLPRSIPPHRQGCCGHPHPHPSPVPLHRPAAASSPGEQEKFKSSFFMRS